MLLLKRGLYVVCGLAAAGCQTYAPYGYNYPGAYTYPTAPAYVQPGMPVYQGAPGYPGAATFAPGAAAPSGATFSAAPATTAPLGSSVPSAGSRAPASTNDPNLVPDSGYYDPGAASSVSPPPASSINDPDADEFKEPLRNDGAAATPADDPIRGVIEQVSAETGPDFPGLQPAPLPEEEFIAPAAFQPASFESAAAESAEPVTAQAQYGGAQPNPFAHDATSHRWYRGLAAYDEEEQVWYIIYNPTPDENDPHGGTITLLPHPGLSRLQKDDVVLIEGGIDPQETDKLGHAKFRATKVQRLTPKGHAPRTAAAHGR